MCNNTNKYIIVNLIGEEPIPNILLIKYLKDENIKKNFIVYDRKLDDGSCKYDKRISNIKNNIKKFINSNFTQKINEDCEIKIEPFNFEQIKKSIKDSIEKSFENFNDTTIIFNITGGTKIMSCALFELAKDLKNDGKKCQIFYINSNNIYNLTESTSPISLVDNIISIDDYFNLLTINNKNIPEKNNSKDFDYINLACKISNISEESDKEILTKFLSKDINNLDSIIERKQEEITNIVTKFYKKFDCYLDEVKNSEKTKKEKNDEENNMNILKGHFFERYMYTILKPIYKKDIKLNIQINNETNEIDIAILKGNILNLIECKFSVCTDGDKTNNIYNISDKQKGIQEKLGKRFVKKILVTTILHDKKTIKQICRPEDITPIPININKIKEKDYLKEIIEKFNKCIS